LRRLALALVTAGLLVLGTAAAPAAAQDLAFRGWGIRGGVSDDPDQVIVGVHANMGEFIPNLRFQPSLELGFGDDHKIFTLTAPAFYRYALNRTFTVYGGGGLALGLDRDDDNGGTEFVISPELAGGFEWPAATGDVFVELGLLGGDLPNARLMLGWSF
jgi:hypothetical protein